MNKTNTLSIVYTICYFNPCSSCDNTYLAKGTKKVVEFSQSNKKLETVQWLIKHCVGLKRRTCRNRGIGAFYKTDSALFTGVSWAKVHKGGYKVAENC